MFELLAFPFFQRALLVGAILGFLMAFLGVFVVLRRMSFFSDALGHSALAGIALGLLLGINPFLAAVVFALLVAIGISGVKNITKLPIDTLLGVFFSVSVALGVIIVSFTPGYQADLISFLFGNILTVSAADVTTSLIMTAIVLSILGWTGKDLIAITLNPNLARAEGIPVARYDLIFLLILAAVIALAIKFVGVILVTALLIIPAAAAQQLSRNLTSMFVWSVIVSLTSVICGMLLSAALSIPSGPAIVCISTVWFIVAVLLHYLRK